MVKLSISTENFELAHGKKPRGTGSWAFVFVRRGVLHTDFAPFGLTYAKACAWARTQATTIGATRIAVGS